MDKSGRPTAEERAIYEMSWRSILRNLLDWSEERAAQWARNMIRDMGDNCLLLHEHAAWYTHRELIPPDVRAKLGPRANAFGSHVDQAVHCRDPRGRNVLDADYDWGAARKRLDALLEQARAGIGADDKC